MKKILFTLVAAFMTASAAAQSVQVAQAMQLDGMPFSFKMHQGKAMVIVYMSASCPACHDAVPFINKLYKDYSQDEVYIAGAFPKESPQELASFKTKFYPSFPLLYKTQKLQAIAPLRTNALPTFVIINKKHRTTARVAGLKKDEIRAELDKALAGAAPEAPGESGKQVLDIKIH